jgi:6-phosphogluconate dehydrogenase
LSESPPPDSRDSHDSQGDDDLLPPLEDAIPCDTLLAFQSLTSSQDLCLTIPLVASMHPIPCILESQLVPALQQHSDDHNSFEMVHQELPDLFYKNVLRRLTSAAKSEFRLTVLLTTEEYIRGVWDAYDSYSSSSNEQQQQQQQSTVAWFVSHLHCWTGRIITEAQLQHQWTKHPPQTNLLYATTSSSASSSLTRAMEYLQQIQVLLPNHHSQQTTYQLWLPQWGQVLSAFTSAHKKFLLKIRQTYQKEVSEKSFVAQPYYKGISSKLLLQWLQDQGVVTLVPKPFGNFITLVDKSKTKKK